MSWQDFLFKKNSTSPNLSIITPLSDVQDVETETTSKSDSACLILQEVKTQNSNQNPENSHQFQTLQNTQPDMINESTNQPSFTAAALQMNKVFIENKFRNETTSLGGETTSQHGSYELKYYQDNHNACRNGPHENRPSSRPNTRNERETSEKTATFHSGIPDPDQAPFTNVPYPPDYLTLEIDNNCKILKSSVTQSVCNFVKEVTLLNKISTGKIHHSYKQQISDQEKEIIKLKTEMTSLKQNFVNKIDNLTQDYKNLQKNLNHEKLQNTLLRSMNVDLKESKNKIKTELDNKNLELKEKVGKLTDLHKKMNKLEKIVSNKNEIIKNLEIEINKFKKDSEKSKLEIADLKNSSKNYISNVNSKNANNVEVLEKQIKKLKSKHKEQLNEIKSKIKFFENNKIHENLENLRSENSELISTIKDYRNVLI